MKFTIILGMLLRLECLFWAGTRNGSYFQIFDTVLISFPLSGGGVCIPQILTEHFLCARHSFQCCKWGSEQNKILSWALKNLLNILSQQTRAGRHRGLASLSGIPGKPPSGWQMDTGRKGESGTLIWKIKQSYVLI